MSLEYDVLDLPEGLKLLTPDVLALCMASWDKYPTTLNHSRTGEVDVLLRRLRHQATNDHLRSTTSSTSKVVQTETVDT